MRFSKILGSLAVAVTVAMVTAGPAGAIVITSLPYDGTPDWIDYKFDGNWSTTSGGSSVLNTALGGIWFGNGNYNDGSPPSWSLGSSTTGNQLDLSMRLVAGSRDWSAYMTDGSNFADMEFNPTYGCNGNVQDCYFAPYHAGVSLTFADPNDLTQALSRFVPLDLTVDHNFGFLLKGGLVAYHINNEIFAGYALASGSSVLVIGDGSGSTRTGSGSMIVNEVSFDTAPQGNVVLSLVPEPASWAMMIGGFALIGASARRSRKIVAASRNG